MEWTNRSIAATLRELADRLELGGEKPYRTRAWRTAADTIAAHQESVAQLVAAGAATSLPGVGKGIGGALEELLETGTLAALEDARSRVPDGMLLLTRVPGIGNSTAQRIWEVLGVESVEALLAAVEAGALDGVPRLQGKARAAIAEHLPNLAATDFDDLPDAMLRDEAEAAIAAASRLITAEAGMQATPAGAFPAGAEELTVAEVLAEAGPDATDDADALLKERFSAAGWQLADISELAPDHRAMRMHSPAGTPVVVHIAPSGAAKVRDAVLPRMPEPVPVAAGARDDTPRLLELADLRGDLHMHSTWSDGRATIQKMAEAALAAGLSYIAITDHSAPYALVNGLDGTRLREQAEEIAAVNQAMAGTIRVLSGIELEITASSGLGLPDEVLSELDWVVASLHMGQGQSAAEIQARVGEALENPHVDCIGHPTSRLIGKRPPTALDVDWLIETAAATGTALEINANPRRLDLSAAHARAAAEAGVGIVINSDAHGPETITLLRHGVAVARAAGLQPGHILNAQPVEQLLEHTRRAAAAR